MDYYRAIKDRKRSPMYMVKHKKILQDSVDFIMLFNARRNIYAQKKDKMIADIS